MHRLTLAQKSFLVGDEVADLLLDYAALLTRTGQGAHVRVRMIAAEGDEVPTQLLLSGGTALIAEPTTSQLPEPDNAELVLHIRDRLRYFGILPADGLWPGSVLR